AMQTVGNRMASLRKIVMGRMHAGRGDVLMLCGPITHASGMFIQPMLYQGATVLLMERFQPAEILEAIEKHRVTMCFFVPAMLDAQGRPVEGGEIGEICVRGPDVFAGFWRAPEPTREALGEDGWLHTGDLARVDREGYIHIVDRKKEMLVSGGFNVYPTEVEA